MNKSAQLLLPALVLFVSTFAFSAEHPQIQSLIRYYNSNNCNIWNYSSPSNGGGSSGYLCATYPSMIQVPDAHSTQMVIDQLEARIKALEAKLGN